MWWRTIRVDIVVSALYLCEPSEVTDLTNSRVTVPFINGDEVTRWWCYLGGEVTMVVITSLCDKSCWVRYYLNYRSGRDSVPLTHWWGYAGCAPHVDQCCWHCPFNSGEVTMVVMSALYLCDEPYWSRYHFNLPSPSVHVISDGKKCVKKYVSLKIFRVAL